MSTLPNTPYPSSGSSEAMYGVSQWKQTGRKQGFPVRLDENIQLGIARFRQVVLASVPINLPISLFFPLKLVSMRIGLETDCSH